MEQETRFRVPLVACRLPRGVADVGRRIRKRCQMVPEVPVKTPEEAKLWRTLQDMLTDAANRRVVEELVSAWKGARASGAPVTVLSELKSAARADVDEARAISDALERTGRVASTVGRRCADAALGAACLCAASLCAHEASRIRRNALFSQAEERA